MTQLSVADQISIGTVSSGLVSLEVNGKEFKWLTYIL